MRRVDGQPEQATNNYSEEHIRRVTQRTSNYAKSKSKTEKYPLGYVEGLNDACKKMCP